MVINMNVLIIDDEPIELKQLELIINAHYPSWNIKKAQFASDALHIAEDLLAENKSFDLALVDIQMPGMSGLELSSKLKEMMPKMEIIIISAYQEFDYAKQSIHLKVIDYILKPVIEQELLEALETFIQLKPQAGAYREIIRQVMKIVERDYKKELKLADIGKELHINASYISRLFKEEVGVNFSDYVLNYRIKKAKMYLLQNKDASMLTVAEQCGFNSQQYFSKVFKRLVGYSPREYRNMRTGDGDAK